MNWCGPLLNEFALILPLLLWNLLLGTRIAQKQITSDAHSPACSPHAYTAYFPVRYCAAGGFLALWVAGDDSHLFPYLAWDTKSVARGAESEWIKTPSRKLFCSLPFPLFRVYDEHIEGVPMSETTRKTRLCTLKDLSPVLSAAIHAHIAQYKLGDLEPSILSCCETISLQPKQGFFGGTEKAISAAFVTPQWLVWVESLNNKIAEVNSALLSHIDIHDYAGSAMGTITPDTGLNITGRYTNAVKTGQAFIGIGADQNGIKFREVLREAVEKQKTKS
jgi:hypothetical protein